MRLVAALGCAMLALQAGEIRLYPACMRTGPDGRIVAADREASLPALAGARAGYISFQVMVALKAPGEYTLDASVPGAPFQVDVFREWYHKLDRGQSYYPDALVPARLPYHSRLPEPDNQIADQKTQAFWVDVWVPADAHPGEYAVTFRLQSGEGTTEAKQSVRVLPARVPDDDVVTIDHNSYGSSWLGDQYPRLREREGEAFYRSDAFFRLIHAYHRIFYEHRGIFHQLGYGHAGKVGPEFAPVLEGSGRKKHIASWDLFDRHYGPLFDGSALTGTRRSARPIPFVYLPINPEWPASYLWWGEPGYETEFVNVVSEMEHHFREKGWTQTRLEMFFNHKKRYMGFPWDGDEVRFPEDNQFFREYGRLLAKAVPADSPVRFVFRADVSWDMEQQSRELAGIVKLWCCGGGILSWYPEMAHALRQRGDIVWFYGGPPRINQPSAKITEFPLQAWLWDIDGFVHWLTVSPGADPWFRFDGGGTALVYSGERFGIEGPVPGIRLKIQRNAVQDLALLASLKGHSAGELRAEVARRFNGSRPEDWWNKRPALAAKPTSEWLGVEIDEAAARTHQMLQRTKSDAWEAVHAYVMELAEEVK